MKTKLEEIVENSHCYDSYRGGCDSDCEYCKNLLRSDLEELVKETREKVIEEFESMLTNKEISQTYDFDDVLCNGNYDANFNDFRDYVRKIVEQLKEQKK